MLAAPEYNITTQAKSVPALHALHNFIQVHDPADTEINDDDNDNISGDGIGQNLQDNVIEPGDEELGGDITPAERECASKQRDDITKAMWADYQRILAERG